MHRYFFLIALITIIGCKPKQAETVASESPSPPKATEANLKNPEGMVWIPGGEFTMGTDDEESYAFERPAHRVRIGGFWMDITEVTNAQFKAFVEATGYVTTAETQPDWEQLKKQLPPGTPKPSDMKLTPGALVFTPPNYAVSLDDYSKWWSWVEGANWKRPQGPGSNITGKENHPVVQVSYDDAVAYCNWAGKRLPTEAEWEFASRGGRDSERYSWGEEQNPQGKFMANTFQGSFPSKNTNDDGFVDSAPVKTFPPNDYGLYDIIGNAWEWTHDFYSASYYNELKQQGVAVNPKGPAKTNDPDDPYAIKRVTRGGSFLCANDYCVNFRPSARQGSAYDSGMPHIGFRCVLTADMRKNAGEKTN